MATPKVHIARHQHCGCILCGRCCRRFHVRLTEAEVTRLQALDWGTEPDVPRDFVHRLHGQAYFRRRADGGCVFLDGQTGACRMHARFGFDAKALTCRGYPHNLASTWRDEVSVVARLDCPAVQQDAGRPLESGRRQIERLVEELGTRGGFTVRQLDGLSREAVERLTRALVGLIEDYHNESPGTLAYALFLLATRCQTLGATFLNDLETLETVLPSLLGAVRNEAATRPAGRFGRLSRILFREWLAAACRRDEELVRPSLAVRLRRSAALAAYAVGAGSLRTMGQEHPDLSLRRVGLFAGGAGWEPSSPAAWESFRGLLVARLEGPQFFGVAYYGEPFFTGLRALLQSYPLVLAAARTHAAARSVRCIETPDVHYAVGAIDHSLGRSPLLQWRLWRQVEEYFAGPRYGRLLKALGWD
jgi:Fe-S-cluster containining protein